MARIAARQTHDLSAERSDQGGTHQSTEACQAIVGRIHCVLRIGVTRTHESSPRGLAVKRRRQITRAISGRSTSLASMRGATMRKQHPAVAPDARRWPRRDRERSGLQPSQPIPNRLGNHSTNPESDDRLTP